MSGSLIASTHFFKHLINHSKFFIMKNLNNYLGAFAIIAMLFTSCSKEETNVTSDEDLATLSFGTVLNDLTKQAKTKQQVPEGYPECIENNTPAYVHVVLEGEENVGSVASPLMVPVSDTPFDEDGDGIAEYFTEESSELELTPGSYQLTYFAVYNDDDDLIWLAPTGDGDFTEWVDSALPLDISLGAGVKKYVDVDVLCFDDRLVNEYGYLFFDIIGVEAIEFCIFGNYCGENGRHYPAQYTVSIWDYEDGEMGEQWYEDVANEFEMNEDGDYAAEPVCFSLPDTSGEDEYYFEITLRNSDAYGEVEEEVIRSGVITDEDVRALFDGDDDVDYFHFREGNCGNLGDVPDYFDDSGNGECDLEDNDADCDEDGILNGDENPGCKLDPDPTCGEDECDLEDPLADCDEDGILNGDENPGCELDPDTTCGEDECDIEDPAADCDDDGILNGNENPGCELNPDENCGENGGEPCLGDPDAEFGCETATSSGEITEDDFPFELFLDGEDIGTVGTELVNGDLVVTIIMNISGDIYLLNEVEISINGTIQCFEVELLGQDEFTIEGDFSTGDDVGVRANVCPVI